MAVDAGEVKGKLTLDKSGFVKAWRGAAKEVKEKGFGGAIKAHSAQIKKMGMVATVAGGAVVGAFGMMVKKYVEAGDQIHKMAQRTGFATETLSELKYAAEISGANIESLEKGVKKMSKTIVDAGDGLTTYIRAFERIGLSVEELEGLNPEEQFLKIGNAIAAVEDPTIRTASAVDIFGRAGTQLLPLFNQGVDGMEALRKKAHELGIVFDQEAANKAARLADAQVTLKGAMQGVSKSIAETFVPMLSKLAEKAAEVISKITDWMKKNPGLTKTIVAIVAGIGGLMLVLGPLLIVLPGIVTAVGLMGAGFLAALGPIVAITAAVGILAVTFLKVKSAQDEARKADERYQENIKKLKNKLNEARKAVGMTGQEWGKLTNKYKGNYAAMAMAIRKGKEGKEMQEALAKVSKKSKEAYDKQQASVKKLGGGFEEAGKKAGGFGEKLISLMKTIKDEIKKASLDEYEYRVWTAKQTYLERKKILEQENAAKEDFVLLEKAHALELEDIEKDRVEAYKEGQKKTAQALTDFFTKAKQKYDNFKGFLSNYKDIVNQLTLDEFEYREVKLDEWYQSELQTLKDSLGNTEKYHEAKALLDDAYKLKKGKIDEDITAKEEEENRKAVEAAQKAWEDKYRHVLGFIDGAGASFGGFVGGLLDKGTTLKDGLAGLWDGIKGSFKGMISDMASEWATGFLKNILTSFTSTATKITETATDAAGNVVSQTSNIAKSVADVGKGLAGLIVSLAKAVATSAKTLAAAAPAIMKVAAMAIAIYAGFKVVSGLIGKIFGGGKGTGAQDYTNKILLTIRDHIGAQSVKMDNTNELLGGFYGKYDTMLDELYKIRDATQGTLAALTSQGTVFVDVFRSAVFEGVGEKISGQVGSLKEDTSEALKGLIAQYESQADKLKNELAKLDATTAREMQILQAKMATATGQEREALQKKMEDLEKQAQEKRKDLINQIQTLEISQANAIAKLEEGVTSSIGGIGKDIGNAVSDVAKGISDLDLSVNVEAPDFAGFHKFITDETINGGIPEYQGGGISTQPGLAMLHGTPQVPEYVIPEPKLKTIVKGDGKSGDIHLHVTQNNNISAMDTIGVRDFMRNKAMPEMVEALDSHHLLTTLQQKLKKGWNG